MKTSYKLPEYLEPYRNLVGNHGGNSIENLIDRLNNEKNLGHSNIIVFSMALSVNEQVRLLDRLYKEGKLK